ncbi:MAG: uncharacterized protein QOF32_1639 [Gammaproteobacteria bacterium]|nr:uncharacterized protein [Gammaproteobacteria bacterium]
MNHTGYRWVLVMLIIGCAACASAPIRYYTLTPPEAAKAAIIEGANLTIEVPAVHTPAQLNRVELMIRTGATEMTLLENERWASPVNDEIRNAVRLELQHRLAHITKLAPWQGFTKLSVALDVHRLEGELGRYALFEASWSANVSGASRASSDIVVKNCAFRAYEEIRGGYAAMVEGYQVETAELADAIAAALRSTGVGARDPCRASPSTHE